MRRDDVIAERQFHLSNRPEALVRLLIERPQPTEEGVWACRYRFVGLGEDIERRTLGVDGFQSLQLAFAKTIPADLQQLLQTHPTLRWEDGDAGDFGIY